MGCLTTRRCAYFVQRHCLSVYAGASGIRSPQDRICFVLTPYVIFFILLKFELGGVLLIMYIYDYYYLTFSFVKTDLLINFLCTPHFRQLGYLVADGAFSLSNCWCAFSRVLLIVA